MSTKPAMRYTWKKNGTEKVLAIIVSHMTIKLPKYFFHFRPINLNKLKKVFKQKTDLFIISDKIKILS